MVPGKRPNWQKNFGGRGHSVAIAAAYIGRDVTEAEAMTPQERELITQLFDRLASLENAPRDPEAERAIMDGLRRAPNAAYALVQTALVQDEALRRANERIQALEAQLGGEPAGRPAGFLDSMRDALLGPREPARAGSVPSVRPVPQSMPDPRAPDPREQAAFALGAPPPGTPWRQGPSPFGGGSFLGTAASTAAGVIGGSLLLDGVRSMMGQHGSFGIADPAHGVSPALGSPWDSNAGGDLSRQAGIDDIGHDQHAGADSGSRAGLFDNSADTDTADDQADQADQDDGSFDDSDNGGGDYSDA
jgi:hypothetical protein